jgi:hypothetical protein
VVSFEIRNRAELVDALSVAAQVEHIVLVEYLYAAFSCRHTVDPTVPPAAAMTSWDIARELYRAGGPAAMPTDRMGVRPGH